LASDFLKQEVVEEDGELELKRSLDDGDPHEVDNTPPKKKRGRKSRPKKKVIKIH